MIRYPLLAVVFAAVLASTGCSWFLMEEPYARTGRMTDSGAIITSQTDQANPNCFTTVVPPILDVLTAGGLGVGGIMVTQNGRERPASDENRVRVISAGLTLVGAGIFYAGSAISGFRWSAQCKEIRGGEEDEEDYGLRWTPEPSDSVYAQAAAEVGIPRAPVTATEKRSAAPTR